MINVPNNMIVVLQNEKKSALSITYIYSRNYQFENFTYNQGDRL